MKHTLSLLIEEEFGVLARITNLLYRRGFNIETMALGSTEVNNTLRITIVLYSDTKTSNQLVRQVYKLINVLEVQDLTNLSCVERELMLLKVSSSVDTRSEIFEIARIFRVKVVDISEDSLILEVTGDSEKISAIIEILMSYGIKKIVRTGKISLPRGLKFNPASLVELPN